MADKTEGVPFFGISYSAFRMYVSDQTQVQVIPSPSEGRTPTLVTCPSSTQAMRATVITVQ